jgi:uncharacterized MAPEG superfamily protein
MRVKKGMIETSPRQFLGKVTGFADRAEQRFHQRALKAYLNGKTTFQMGFDDAITGREPMMWNTPVKRRILKSMYE